MSKPSKNKEDVTHLQRGAGVCIFILTLLFTAKMLGLTTISWSIVFAPVWLPVALGFIMISTELMLGKDK
jgi:hypothetical protein